MTCSPAGKQSLAAAACLETGRLDVDLWEFSVDLRGWVGRGECVCKV